jgi:hypothetical protein
MKSLLVISASILLSALLQGQTIIHPWHVVDRGGGKSASGGINLHSSIGQPAIQASASGGINLEAGYIPGVRQLGGAVTTFAYNAEDTWNMLSVPLIMSDYKKTTLYPAAASVAFAYTGSYQQRDTLRNLTGYWIKFPAPNVVEFTGTALTKDTVNVSNSWNMVGCLSYPVKTTDIIALGTSVTSNYFGYSSGLGYYSEDTLKPGRAYWVKVNGAGKLAMATGSVMITPTVSSVISTKSKSDKEPEENFSSLSVRDAQGKERTLKFTSRDFDFDLTKYELPPVPPTFDVRFASNKALEFAEAGNMKEIALRISSAEYPLGVSWNSIDDASLLIDGKEISLKGSGTTQISNPGSRIKLKLFPSGKIDLPKEFALRQNFPNPFNPTTTIRYDMPVTGYVLLKVYDLMGQEIVTLVDGMQDAGYKSVVWNASDVSSGVYFYRLTAGKFTEAKKLLLMR